MTCKAAALSLGQSGWRRYTLRGWLYGRVLERCAVGIIHRALWTDTKPDQTTQRGSDWKTETDTGGVLMGQ